MDTKIKEIVDDARSQDAKVEIFGNNIVQVMYKNGKISRYTLENGILTTESMYTDPKGNTYFSEVRTDPITQTFGQEDLLKKFQTDAHFYNYDGKSIDDVGSLQNKREEINSMSDKEVLEKYGKDKKFLALLIGDAIDTVIRSQEAVINKDNDTEQYVNFDDVDF